MTDLLKIGNNITCVPIIHGRSIFAQKVRDFFLDDRYQCIAVELPPSLQDGVLEAVKQLPLITSVIYKEQKKQYCYVPVEPGEAIIEALRLGIKERTLLEFVDMETETFQEEKISLPDEYAIQQVGLRTYYETVIPYLQKPEKGSSEDLREQTMAGKLRQLDKRFRKILFVCGMAHLEGIKRHFYAKSKIPKSPPINHKTKIYALHSDSIYLLTGEIPYITFLYEKSRYHFDAKCFDKTDGIKELLIETRKEFCREFPEELERLTPTAMQCLLKYMRNLCLIQGNITPSMYDLIVAGQGVGGAGFGAKLIEMAKLYPYQDPLAPFPLLHMGIKQGWTEKLGNIKLKNRFPTPPFSLKSIKLEKKPNKEKKAKWKRHWGPNTQCSWPEEDDRIENFTKHVKLKALGLLGQDQAKTEKFTVSIKDGLDIRETLRQWHTGNIYVKELPPVRGDVGAVVFIFDSEANNYPWRSTWLAEHDNESTLCFYAKDYREDLVGPGIARSFYGGALFIFPPITIFDIWQDKKFKEHKHPPTKLVAAASCYSSSRYIAYVGSKKPSFEMINIAKRNKKHLIFIPLSNFSAYTIRKLRKFHVLQGEKIRSYANKYIR